MLNEKINFEMLPSAVSKILNDVSEIKKFLMHNRPREPNGREVLSFKKALLFLSDNGYQISESKLYKLTSNKMIPHGKINNKLIFYKQELIQWTDSQIIINPNNQTESVINSAIILSKKKYKHGRN